MKSPWDAMKQDTLSFLPQIPGWCTSEKAGKIMELIKETKPLVCVEIGVFGGSSIYPTAKALSFLGQGVVYAIDPWSTEECLKGYNPGDANYEWWNQVDLEKVYQDFLTLLSTEGLQNYCTPMRMTSEEAERQFGFNSIDILHVDGNHTQDVAFTDVDIFFPKVKVGGYIWLDDVKWSDQEGIYSLDKAFHFIEGKCEVIASVDKGNCILLKKIKR